MKEPRCNCNGYIGSMPQIESAQVLAYTQGLKYTGEVFKFCPWCSLTLKPITESTKERKEENGK